jgi:hypothetical protein
MLILNGDPYVSDFGLALIEPRSERLTAGQDRLGPIFFLPDELLNAPELADGRTVDVFEFAKSLWVLFSRRRFPPGGAIRHDDPTHQLSGRFEFDIAPLQRLIERCTVNYPEARQSMAEVHEDLSEMLLTQASGKAIGMPHSDRTASASELAELSLNVQGLPPVQLTPTFPAADLESAIASLVDACSPVREELVEHRFPVSDWRVGRDFWDLAASATHGSKVNTPHWRTALFTLSPPSANLGSLTVCLGAVGSIDTRSITLGIGGLARSKEVPNGRVLDSYTDLVRTRGGNTGAVTSGLAKKLQESIGGWIRKLLNDYV